MYDNLVFAKVKPFLKTSDVNEAIKFTTTIGVTPATCKLGEIKVNDNGTITDNEVHNITEYGFENLCKILGIPHPFAKKIPLDLLFTNIIRLQQEKRDVEVVLLFRENGDVANITTSPYKEVSSFEVLSMLADKSNISHIDVCETILNIGFSFDKTVIVREEDTFLVNSFLYNYPLNGHPLEIISGLYRNECKNSFVMNVLGGMKADYRLERDVRLLRFTENLEIYNQNILEIINRKIHNLQSCRIFDFEFQRLWNGVKGTAGQINADIMLETGEEERKEIFQRVNNRNIHNKQAKIFGTPIDEPLLVEQSGYGVLNNITKFAQDYLSGFERKNLEILAGKWMGDLILNSLN